MGKAVEFRSIAKRDRDREAFKATHISKHQRDRMAGGVVYVAVRNENKGQK